MYDLEIDRVIEEISKNEYKSIMIHLPDGLKPKADEIVDKIESETDAECFIWFSSCFGNCDIPLGLENMNVDLFVHWGHNRFHKEEW